MSILPVLVSSYAYQRILCHIGIHQVHYLVLVEMLIATRPWQLQPLAYHLGVNRNAIRPFLTGLTNRGTLRKGIHGWSATTLGRRRILLLFGEVLEILQGQRKGFSPDRIRHILEYHEQIGTAYPPTREELLQISLATRLDPPELSGLDTPEVAPSIFALLEDQRTRKSEH